MEAKEFKSFMKTVGGNEGSKCKYTTRLDVYGCGCQHDCKYCVDGDTLVLMYDGTSKKIKDIEIGDEIYGVEKDISAHKLVKSTILNKWETIKPSYKITLANGVEIICSENHRWLSNRGWKYTIGKMSGENRRPYLTTNNHLIGFTNYSFEVFEETNEYKRGYLTGIINGDGHIGEYHYENQSGGGDQYQFRLALKDEDAIVRVANYLNDFEIEVAFFDFSMVDRKTKEEVVHKAIRTNKKFNYEKIVDIISVSNEPSKEYLRGFMAGFYDAEGCSYNFAKRVYNTDNKLIDTYVKGLEEFSFKYVFDKEIKTHNGLTLKTVRLVGGMSEILRFYQTTLPAIKRKFSFDGIRFKNAGVVNELKVVSIEPYKNEQVLYDITTSTENFIANGVVSHNCYAKSLLDFRKLWNPTNPSIADIEKVKRKIAKLPKDTPPIRLGGMSDMFQPAEKRHKLTYETIKALNENNIPYLIVTKGAMIADDEYIELLDKDLAHIQITVTTTDDKLSTTYEKASLPSERIKAIEKLQENGFDVQLRLSPFIPQYIDFDILNNVKCDKILIEFLRVNTWIKKWFDIDYSDYTVKQSGYSHLPLEKKLEYIKNITGFKEMTVCEDEDSAYEYWKNNFNHNSDDCCNLRIK